MEGGSKYSIAPFILVVTKKGIKKEKNFSNGTDRMDYLRELVKENPELLPGDIELYNAERSSIDCQAVPGWEKLQVQPM